MTKQASIVTVAKQGDGYSVDARGAFGGGWTRHTTREELQGTIIRAWQMYGNNPLGCDISGDIPEDVQSTVDKLKSSTGKAVITLRVSEAEANIIRARAEAENLSVNQWIINKIFG
jgi:hypothetical protein